MIMPHVPAALRDGSKHEAPHQQLMRGFYTENFVQTSQIGTPVAQLASESAG